MADFSANMIRFIKIINLLWGLVTCYKKIDRIDSAVLVFIGKKQTDKQEESVNYSFEFKFINITTIKVSVLPFWDVICGSVTVTLGPSIALPSLHLFIHPSPWILDTSFISIHICILLYFICPNRSKICISRYFTIYSCIYIFTIYFPRGKY